MSTTTPPYVNMPEQRATGSGFAPNVLDWIALVLMIVGGLNWGLVGAFNLDLVARLFGDMTPVSRAVYLLVGLAALYALTWLGRFSRRTAT